MLTQKIIDEIKNRLIEAYNPLEIYLFGSYAWGTPDEQSDLDLLIVVESADKNPYTRPLIGYDALMDIDIPNDIFVYTKEEFEKRSNDLVTLDYKIKREGKLLYARA